MDIICIVQSCCIHNFVFFAVQCTRINSHTIYKVIHKPRIIIIVKVVILILHRLLFLLLADNRIISNTIFIFLKKEQEERIIRKNNFTERPDEENAKTLQNS
jgi:hypothetical protein